MCKVSYLRRLESSTVHCLEQSLVLPLFLGIFTLVVLGMDQWVNLTSVEHSDNIYVIKIPHYYLRSHKVKALRADENV